MQTIICAICKCSFGIPDELHEVSVCGRVPFYCPYGHRLVMPASTSEVYEDDDEEEKDNVIRLVIDNESK